MAADERDEGPDDFHFETMQPSEADVAANRAHHERYESLEEAVGGRPQISNDDRAAANLISKEANDLIVDFEVGGPQEYKRKFIHPEWPAVVSGVTIGIGYDLGYCEKDDFASDWREHLSPEDFAALEGAVGLKRDRAKSYLPRVKDLVVPWVSALQVYQLVDMPSFAGQTRRAFPGSDKLHPHCFGVLVSLVFNRGSSLSGERRSEMYQIQRAIGASQPDKVPHLFRQMARLWPDTPGLIRRRKAEASLFERGLIERENERRLGPPIVVAAAGPTPNGGADNVQESVRADQAAAHDGDGRGQSDADFTDVPPAETGQGPLEAARPEWAGVHWIDDDTLSPDYRHLLADDRHRVNEISFLFTAADLELLIRANQFVPLDQHKRIIFGLRGATLAFDASANGDRTAQVNRQGLRLKACRPDHQHLRCVIGVYNTETRLLSGFMASTVPNRGAVQKCMETGRLGNLLATGCYDYIVGSHHSGRYKGCLRQNEPVAALRSRENLVYDVGDVWDVSVNPDKWPIDNIHPAFSDGTYHSADFSSFGCQVIRGRWQDDGYTDEFAKFRRTLGLAEPAGADNGNRYSYVLLTGDEAAIAGMLREQNRAGDHDVVRASLARLRQGSRGAMVERLQTALKLHVDGSLTAVVKKVLIDVQRQFDHKLAGDGIYSPQLDAQLSLGVFAPPEAPATTPPPYMAGAQVASNQESVNGNGTSGNTFESVFYDIGRRSAFAQANPALLTAQVLPQYESVTQESWSGMVQQGKKVLARAELMLHDVLCGDDVTDKDDRNKFRTALAQSFGGGRERVIGTLSRIITGTLMIPSLVSTPIAEILYDRLGAAMGGNAGASLDAQMGTVCIAWRRKLQDAPGAAPTGVQAAIPVPQGAAARAPNPPPPPPPSPPSAPLVPSGERGRSL